MKKIIVFVFLMSFLPTLNSHDLEAAISSEERSPKNITRDSSRHPYETLTFFEIKPNMKVVELSPGGGWYSEILANYIHKPGKLIAAHFDKDSQRAYFQRSRASFERRINEDPLFKDIEIVDLSSSLAKPGSVDAILTFRNLHNWLGPQMDTIFANSSKALKPGGLFGVVEHRAKPGTSMEMMKKSGYVTEEHAIAVAKKHGFTLVARSEVNSNPKDTANHPGGVWTLPPSLRLKDKNREKYLEIGESDRMTLLFKKS
ncbi:methyltransferase [Gammaproteobacteria bacterium]|nr:methyltransferase [Gammaproteobacteria bacterium]